MKTEIKSPVSLELYNRIVGEYRKEIESDPMRETTIESRFSDVIDLQAADDLAGERGAEECDNIDEGSYDTPETRRNIALGRMYSLGLEVGFRLGQAAFLDAEFNHVRSAIRESGNRRGVH